MTHSTFWHFLLSLIPSLPIMAHCVVRALICPNASIFSLHHCSGLTEEHRKILNFNSDGDFFTTTHSTFWHFRSSLSFPSSLFDYYGTLCYVRYNLSQHYVFVTVLHVRNTELAEGHRKILFWSWCRLLDTLDFLAFPSLSHSHSLSDYYGTLFYIRYNLSQYYLSRYFHLRNIVSWQKDIGKSWFYHDADCLTTTHATFLHFLLSLSLWLLWHTVLYQI